MRSNVCKLPLGNPLPIHTIMNTPQDQFLCDAVSRMVGCSRSADYFLMKYCNPKKHVEFAVEAQRVYRTADVRLQELGVVDNVARQNCIHGIVSDPTS